MSVNDPNSTDLASLLSHCTWRSLNGYAWHSGFGFHHEQSREELAKRLTAHLRKGAIVKRLLSTLSQSAKELLMSILAGDGSITESLLKLIGGEIRPLNYQQVKDAPWRTPSNDSEELVYRGLLLARKKDETVYYQITDELIPALSAELLSIEPLPQSLSQSESDTSVANVSGLLGDMLILLLYCQKHSPKVLKGIRFPLPVVRQLMLLTHASQKSVRSHTQSPYLWFLANLALQADLLSAPSAGYFMPTPVAYEWVNAPRSQQLAHLWHSWQPERTIRWPPATWASDWNDWWQIRGSLLSSLHEQIALLSDEWQNLETWSSSQPMLLALTEVGHYSLSNQSERTTALRLFTEELLPALLALALVEISADRKHICLHELGSLWLKIDPETLTNQTTEAINQTATQIKPLLPKLKKNAFRRKEERLIIPTDADFSTIWQIGHFADLKSADKELEFELTPTTVALGLNQGFPIATLRHALAAGGIPFSRDLLPQHPAPRLRQAIWLETNEPSQMRQLRAERSIQFALRGGESLSGRRHTVDPRYLSSLQKALTDLGQPAVTLSPKNADHNLRELFDAPRPTHPLPHSALLLLATRLWQRQITQHDKKYPSVTRTPPYIPIALVNALEASLTPLERAAVEQIWHKTLEQLDPEIHLPPPVQAQDDKGLSYIEPLQQAIDAGLAVHIKYEPAGKDVSQRTIDPHYLQKRRNIWYLHAYCRKAQDNRNFRLDRIRTLTVIELPKQKQRK